MKKNAYSFLFAVVLAVAMISCNKAKITDIQLNRTSLVLDVGETGLLTVTVLPADAAEKTVTWESSDNNVATVDNGLVTAKTEGRSTVTVTTKDGNKTTRCIVTVKKPYSAEPEMVLVEGGTFTMGCTDGECESNEFPTRKVTLSSFKMAKYPVTQKQWIVIMGRTITEQAALAGQANLYGAGDNYPIHYVSWSDAQEFIQKLNASTGKNYRLPTEAEWEYAARGGEESKGYKYSGGNDIDTIAWYYNNSGQTKSVGTKAPNELGIYDMSGNVYEWCSDWYGPDYQTNSPQNNPIGPATGSNRVLRGGSWSAGASACRVSYRISNTPNFRKNDYGFRLVLVP